MTCDDLTAREEELREMIETLEEAIRGAEEHGDTATAADLREELRTLEVERDRVMDKWETLGRNNGYDPEDGEPAYYPDHYDIWSSRI